MTDTTRYEGAGLPGDPLVDEAFREHMRLVWSQVGHATYRQFGSRYDAGVIRLAICRWVCEHAMSAACQEQSKLRDNRRIIRASARRMLRELDDGKNQGKR